MHRFVHIPKNGGSAVVLWLENNNIPFVVGKAHKRFLGKHKKAKFWQDENSVKFCVVRHPYTRTVSYFNYIAQIEGWTSFEDFVRLKMDPVRFKIPSPWELQSTWILDDQGQSLCSKIFKYENLESELQQYFDCSGPLTWANKTEIKLVQLESVSTELKQIIYQHHQEDFERFGYSI